jgi:hypothetical protein
MLDKRKEHFKRMAEEIERKREGQGDDEFSFGKANRVDNTTLFLRIREMQKKGGTGNVPLC